MASSRFDAYRFDDWRPYPKLPDDLEDDAKSFIKDIEEKLGVPVTLIGTGPHVDDVIDIRA